MLSHTIVFLFCISLPAMVKAGDLIAYQDGVDRHAFHVAIVSHTTIEKRTGHVFAKVQSSLSSIVGISGPTIELTLPRRFAPEHLLAMFDLGKSHISRRTLSKTDLEQVEHETKMRAATCIQRWAISRLYKPPCGRMYLKIKST